MGKACGFETFLGESETVNCELHYAAKGSAPDVVVGLREYRSHDLEQAWALHRRSFPAEVTGETSGSQDGVPGSRWSSYEGQRWVFLPGWGHARRVSWAESDCTAAQIEPVLKAAVEAREAPPSPTPRWSTS
ncbi:MAG: hypothetical protein K0V04_41645, partial [Deltaproteobacteria bacterium]|nr:hypothetical protein [Deltaproteobacteria bacterium]